MFINIKLSKLFKIFFIVVAIIMVVFFAISAFQIYSKTANSASSNSEVIDISPSNYTNVLKAVHENLDNYIGKRIHFTGFVYRVYDLTDTQFVLARNMIISSNNNAVVVGFLCNYENAKELQNNSWIEITGNITKGNYHGEIPEIEIESLNQVECPTDEFVYPPDDSFIPTNSII